MTELVIHGEVVSISKGYDNGTRVSIRSAHGEQMLRLPEELAPRIHVGMRATLHVEFSAVIDSTRALVAA